MSNRPVHVCFYSKKCPHSKSFLEELAKTSFSSEFQFICVDPGPNRPKLPSWLSCVPTLLIDGEPDPLTDEKVMNWLSLRRIQGPAKQSNQMNRFVEPPSAQSTSSRNKEPVQAPVYKLPEPVQTRSSPNTASKEVKQPATESEPLGMSMEIISGNKWSDAYSFIDDQFSIEKGTGNSRFERNFSLLDDGLMGQQVSQPKEVMSEKARVLNSAFDDYRKQRDSDVPGPVARR
jgi:hypothetical protein